MSISTAGIYGYLVDHANKKYEEIFFYLVLSAMTLLFLRWVFDIINQVLIVRFSNQILFKARENIINSSANSSITDSQKIRKSEFISRLLNDLDTIHDQYVTQIFYLFYQVTVLVISSIVVLYIQPVLFLVILVGSLLVFAIPTLMTKKLQINADDYSNKSERLTAFVTDYFNGLTTIKSNQAENLFKDKFEDINQDFTKTSASAGSWYVANWQTSGALGMMIQFVVTFVSIWFIMQGNFTVGLMLTVSQVMNTLVFPLIDVFKLVPQILANRPIVKKVNDLILSQHQANENVPTLKFNSSIKLNDVSLKIEGKSILSNINLDFEKRKKYLVLGNSGSGKSTVMKLISGYYDNYEGEITIDGQATSSFEQLIDNIAYVEQTAHIFETTVQENILLSRAFEESKMEKVLSISQVDAFLNEDKGLNTVVDESHDFSGGERQRIAIARELYQDKPVIIFDESLSGINPETSNQIENDFLNNDNLTFINITHHVDLQLLPKYDSVVWIKDGHVFDFDTPDSIIKKAVFKKFVKATDN
jgi:ABC-type multidrug transport system fused ATPase/permease subunit